MLDKVQDTSIIEFVDDDLENIMATEVNDINDINELASMLASIGMEDEVDDEFEALMDTLYAEHEAMMYAANSYDNDAIEYGEMV
jgi:hypothetical protein